jgi:hypothetical protein
VSDDRDSYDRQYVGTHAAGGAPPVTLADELPRYRELDHERTDLWEETAFALIAESGDHDILLWTAGYLLKSNGRGVWVDKAAAEHDIMFIAVPKSQRGTMSDNNFVRAGWQPGERLRLEDVKIDADADCVRWQFDEQQFIARPPLWQARGRIAGVELDLTFAQQGQPIWNWGAFADAAKADRAGYDVFARVDGSIRAGGRTFAIEGGHGVREHILVGQASDPVRNLPPPRVMWWLYVTQGDIGINFFRPGSVDIGTLYAGAREIKFNPAAGLGSIAYQETAWWDDPRNGYRLPVRWRLAMASAEAVVELDIRCHGRAYEHWTLSQGVRLYCYQLCTCDGFVQFADGRKVAFENRLLLNSFNRTILVRQERFDGPVY